MGLTEDQMMEWGWRIPFLIVFPWGLFAVYLRRGLHEPDHGGEASMDSKEIVQNDTPIKRVWRTHRWHLVCGTLMFAGQHVGFWGNIIFVKSFLIQADIRTVMWALAATLILVVFPLWVLMVVPDQSWASLVAEAIFGVFDGILGIVLILIALELFPVSVRATGIGLSYNIAHALFSSVTPLIAGAIWKNWKHLEEKADADSVFGRTPWLANTAPAMWPLICYCITTLALVPLMRGWIKTESNFLMEADMAGGKMSPAKDHR